jgi:hypothetical protein
MIPIHVADDGAPAEVIALASALRQRMRGKISVQPVDFMRADDQPWRHWAIKVVVSHLQGVLVWYVPSSRRVSMQSHGQGHQPRVGRGRFDEQRIPALVAEILGALRADWRLAA